MRARLPRGVATTAVLASLVLCGFTGAAHAARDGGTLLLAPEGQAVEDSYIVVLDRRAVDVASTARSLAAAHDGVLRHTYSASLRGFAVTLNEQRARKLAADPAVAYVAQDTVVGVGAVQANPPSWGLDRIDKRRGVNDFRYTYANTGAGVTAYVIDTGIRITHPTFQGRARHGFDFVDNDASADDCHGHGTHVAGTVGGAEYGVAKGVGLVAVRVLDCSGGGALSTVVAGIDWVTRNAARPAVVNMSLGTTGGVSQPVDDAVAASIAAGLTYAVAAGNQGIDACTRSPARVPSAITVSATDQTDAKPSWANFGPCVDIFAPGVDIVSAGLGSGGTALSGTSMAAPHVAGVAARYLQRHPGALPQQVRDAIADATTAAVTNPPAGTSNRLLYSHLGGTDPDAVGTVTVAGDHPYTFVRGADGNLWVNWWNGSSWIWGNQGRPASGAVDSGIGAVTVGNGLKPFAFVRGTDGNLWVNWWNGSVWTWSDQGRPGGAKVDSKVGVVTVDGGEKPFVFVLATDGNLWVNWFDGALWHWSNQGRPASPVFPGIDTGVGAVAVEGNKPFVFVRGNDGNLHVNWFNGSSWAWSDQGRPGGAGAVSLLGAGAGVVAVEGNKPFVFVRGNDGNLYVNWFNGSVWAWSNQGRPPGSAAESGIAAVLAEGYRPYVFVRGTDANLWVNWFDGANWIWGNQGRPPGTTPESGLGAVTVGAARTFVFLRGRDTNMWVHWWNGGAWIWGNHGTR